MDVLLTREPIVWDPNVLDEEPECEVVAVDDSKLPASLHAFAPERFVPYSALAGQCPASVDALTGPGRPMANGRAALAAAWPRLVDGIIIISLREATGRRARLAKELRIAGLLPESESKIFWYIADRPRADFGEGRGRFGCMRSHIAVTVEAERRGWKRWMVLEDDAYFSAEACAGVVHNAADAMDADPQIAVLALGTILVLCDEQSTHEARNIFPVKLGNGTAAMVTTPTYTRTLAPLRDVYGDPEERREATQEELGSPYQAIDIVIFCSDYVKKHGGVYQALPNIVNQKGATTIGYGSMSIVTIGSWLGNKLGIGHALKKISHPHVLTAVGATAAFVAILIALIAAAIYIYKWARERRRTRRTRDR